MDVSGIRKRNSKKYNNGGVDYDQVLFTAGVSQGASPNRTEAELVSPHYDLRVVCADKTTVLICSVTVLCLGTVIALVVGVATLSSVIVATVILLVLAMGFFALGMLTKVVDRQNERQWQWRFQTEENESERRSLIEEHREERMYMGQQHDDMMVVPQQGSPASGTTATIRELPDLDLPPTYHECIEDPRSKK